MAQTNIVNSTRLETLTKDNYDTWCIQVEALLIKNDMWGYINGDTPKPEIPADPDEASRARYNAWALQDRKAKSDLILSINPSELRQIRGCVTAKEVWDKLATVYASKGPRRKATLLKQLTQRKLQKGEDIKDHLATFFQTVDKLNDMEIEIDKDLLSIMILNTLPDSFENFRCAMESRDNLPDPETLKIKIIEEVEARKQKVNEWESGAMYVKQHPGRSLPKDSDQNSGQHEGKGSFGNRPKYKCSFCGKIGHKAASCYRKRDSKNQNANIADEAYFISPNIEEESAQISNDKEIAHKWCIDSGCTSHLSNDKNSFSSIQEIQGGLKLASSATTQVRAKGDVTVFTSDGKHDKLENTLFVPDLRNNLISVAKIVDKNNDVLFTTNNAYILDTTGKVKLVADRDGDLFFLRDGSSAACLASDIKNSSAKVWHQRLGHLNFRDMSSMMEKQLVMGMDFKNDVDLRSCKPCAAGKLASTPFPKIAERSPVTLGIIHADLCGPMRNTSKGGALYFLTLTDDHTR